MFLSFKMLPNYNPCIGATSGSANRDTLIKKYFNLGLQYLEILGFLQIAHGISLSLRQLKRILKILGLQRRGQLSHTESILFALENELVGSGSSYGYRRMHQVLREDYKLNIDRHSVRILLAHLDPDGVSNRKRGRLRRRKYSSKGPNHRWHIDGYDKLKPFGFCIHGAIDGYSRRIMWLEVASTNNDPKVVAKYFVDCVEQIGGCPNVIRADSGTENVTIAALQRYFRSNDDDEFAGMKSFMYGKSTSNQRIEAWWAFLKRSTSHWWINFFKDLRDSGLYCDDDMLNTECLRFCFMGVLQTELHDAARHWNLHRIRPYPNQETPPGKPDLLFFLPELRETADYKTQVSYSDIEVARNVFCKPQESACTPEFFDVFKFIMEENGMVMPTNAEEAKQLYIHLVDLVTNEL